MVLHADCRSPSGPNVNNGTLQGVFEEEDGSAVLYVEHYLDCVENLPNDLQRHVTKIRECDVSYQALMKEVDTLMNDVVSEETAQNEEEGSSGVVNKKRMCLTRRLRTLLLAAQEVGDQKLQIVQDLQDAVENTAGQLEANYRAIDSRFLELDGPEPLPLKEQQQKTTRPSPSLLPSVCVDHGERQEREQRQSRRIRRFRLDNSSPIVSSSSSVAVKSMQQQQKSMQASLNNGNPSRHYNQSQYPSTPYSYQHEGSTPLPRTSATLPRISATLPVKRTTTSSTSVKKKKRKSRQSSRHGSPQKEVRSVDPDEPTYCLCDQISFGEMICCDNDLCPIEWFHFSCVSLSTKPKGKWYCPMCRGEKQNTMKPKAQFLKELERYNKEKEEKGNK